MKKLVLSLIIAFLLAACGDTVENTTVNQMGMEVVASEDDLPECTEDNEGEQAAIKGEATIRVCMDGDWASMNGGGSADFSCTTKELKDKSGLKIICNGDSIGVVLNGEKGEKGETGKTGKSGEEGSGCAVTQTDSAITVVCGDDSTTIELGARETAVNSDAVSLDSLAGYSQKGPFLKGATVYLYELDNGKTLKQTNGNFTSYITRDDGYYKFTARNLVSPYALVIVDGNYRNEVTGKVSDQPIRLKALSDVRKHRKGANVNILTHLEYEHVYNLVTQEGMNFAAAKKKAQKDIFKAFNIELEEEEDAEVLDIFGKKEGDAALLALSVLLQGDRSAADMIVLLTEISSALAEKGEWNDSVAKAKLADWALRADNDNRFGLFRQHVRDWMLGGDTTVPDFIPYIRNYINTVNDLGACGDSNNPVGTFAHVPNKYSSYYAKAYDSIDAAKNSLARVVCDDKGGEHWRIATDLERDTNGWEKDSAGTVRKGQIDTSLTYVYEDGWRHGTDLDRVVGFGCIKAFKDSVAKVSDSSWFACTVTPEGNCVWQHLMSNREKDSVSLKAYKDSIPGLLLDAPFTKKTMVWDADTLREANDYEILLKKACVTSMYGKSDSLSNTLTYTCDESGWSKTGTFADIRSWSYVKYKAVQIGDQVWMAENLNHRYFNETKELDSSSFCYRNNCDKYGRLYLWSAAIDSAGLEKNSGIVCGYGRTCSLPARVRGACPTGWHLPTRAEFETLFNAVARDTTATMSSLAAIFRSQDWNGSDAYGFSALPAGCYYGAFDEVGETAFFWTATEINDILADYWVLELDRMQLGPIYNSDYGKNYGYSVRCVKD